MRQAEEIRIRSLEVKPQSATCKAAPQPYQLPTTTPALYVWKPGMNSAGAADRLLQAFARCVYDKERITEQYKLCFRECAQHLMVLVTPEILVSR